MENMEKIDSSKMGSEDQEKLTEDQAITLEAFSRALAHESHVLTQAPEILWQQLYNLLQWESGMLSSILAAELDHRGTSPKKPWVRIRTPFQESKALNRTLQGHESFVNYCVISPDCSYIVSASTDNTLKIWDAKTGAEKATLSGHTDSVSCCTISPDGTFIVSSSWDKTVKVWDAGTWVERYTLSAPGSVSKCVVTNDSRKIISNGGGNLQVWNAQTGKLLYELKDVRSRFISKDGRWCASTIDTTPDVFSRVEVVTKGILHGPGQLTITVWDIENQKEIFKTKLRTKSQSISINCLDFSPDGRFMIAATDKIFMWDLDKGKIVKTLEPQDFHVNSCSFSPDGQQIAIGGFSASDNRQWNPGIQLWDVESAAQKHTLTGHERISTRLPTNIYCVAFSPDNRFLVSAASDYTLRTWDLANPETEQSTYMQTAGLSHCSSSLNGQWVVAGGGNRLGVWEAQNLNIRQSWRKDQIEDCFINPDGSKLVTTFSKQPFMNKYERNYFASIWDAHSGKELHTLKGSAHRAVYRCGGFSPDGRFVVTAGFGPYATNVVIWDVESGKEHLVLKGSCKYIENLCFSPDGRWVLSAGGETNNDLRLWDAQTGKITHTLNGHNNRVQTCAFSWDSKWILSGDWDGALKIWDASIGKEIKSMTGHDEKVTVCGFSPDNQRVLSMSEDSSMRLWDVETEEEIGFIPQESFALSGAVNPIRPLLTYCDVNGHLNMLEVMN